MRAVLMTGLKQSRRGSFKCCVNQELTMSRTVARMHHCRARRKGVRGGAAEVGSMKKWMRRIVPGALIGLSLAAGGVAGPVVLMPGPGGLEARECRPPLRVLRAPGPARPTQ